MFSRSFTEAGDTIAAQELDPGDLGAQSLRTTTKTKCTATVENEKVSIDNLDRSLRNIENGIFMYLPVYLFSCFLVCSASYQGDTSSDR